MGDRPDRSQNSRGGADPGGSAAEAPPEPATGGLAPQPPHHYFLGLSFHIRDVNTYLLGLWLRSNETTHRKPFALLQT